LTPPMVFISNFFVLKISRNLTPKKENFSWIYTRKKKSQFLCQKNTKFCQGKKKKH
jgi:hypothetical protein